MTPPFLGSGVNPLCDMEWGRITWMRQLRFIPLALLDHLMSSNLVNDSPSSEILRLAESGEEGAAAELLPLVYDELRRLAAAKLRQERPGQTLDATALVHEAYLRIVGGSKPAGWNGRGHFFAAAGEAMRRILVEAARRKKRVRHGGGRDRVELADVPEELAQNADDLVAVDEALAALEAKDPETAQLVKLHYFLGLSFRETAQILGISERTAHRSWAYARAWLHRHLQRNSAAE